MPIAYRWQKLAFIKELAWMVSQIGGEKINDLQFRLLIAQANILFATPKNEKRCMSLFKKFGSISKQEFVSSISLVETEVRANKRYNIVRLLPTSHEIEHCSNRCFSFWMNLMRERYGPIHMWFQILCQEKDIRRVSIQNFLGHLNRVLKGSQHEECSHKISMMFEKSRKNQVLFSVFTNTIIINRNLLSSCNEKNTRKVSVSLSWKQKTETKDSESVGKTSYDTFVKSGRRKLWSAKSTNQRYTTTPNKLIITTKDQWQS